ncbi:hypothetical protein EDB81DRAFT_147060 [Dactylonectria macrodidyma]|uniref:Uncharacterized protein n=1 Tax=Dactylonectria macrodidyma TaxID=307937 RepID=A0A9P9IP08_9HYPO|nr:hypothetical protein EDB81DRAFT_147060 [Dactylonectria macrodidyma]
MSKMRCQPDRHSPWWSISPRTASACRRTRAAGSITEKPDGYGGYGTGAGVVHAQRRCSLAVDMLFFFFLIWCIRAMRLHSRGFWVSTPACSSIGLFVFSRVCQDGSKNNMISYLNLWGLRSSLVSFSRFGVIPD